MPTLEERRFADALDLVAIVEGSFPSSRFSDAAREQYVKDLAHLDTAEAAAAVEVLKRSGREFAPTAGEVCREVARLQVDAPDWAEVKRQLVKRWDATVAARERPDDWTCPYGRCDGSGFIHDEERNDATDCPCRPEKREASRGEPLHPLLREFIDASYVTWGEVEAVGRGMATTLEAQMRDKWQAFAHRAVESRAIAAIDGPPTLRRLERARGEDAPRRAEGLKRPDVLAALTSGG